MSFSTKLSSHSLFRRICASHLCHKTIRQLSQDPRNGAPANWTTAYFALLRARLQQPITSTRLVACVAVVAHQRCSSTCVHCASRLWSHHSEVRLLRIQCELGNWQVDGTEYDEICKVLEENLLCKTSRKYFIQVLLVIFRKCRSLSSGLGAVKLALYEIWEVLIFFFFSPSCTSEVLASKRLRCAQAEIPISFSSQWVSGSGTLTLRLQMPWYSKAVCGDYQMAIGANLIQEALDS